ncbi:unnamed protein product [Rotaria magnacalcarata]|uniref:Uncharacterized protein n=1 Tax=Rotaria magnacalcarata TaxID=392030 RepID=A0A819ESN6_9BILA|nr:unnamed protein product [Rotaria magnacalcarata]CAF2151959.1 unnamed protein product [Rotaria magnacalcarata]CAF3854870.1 unnamed protein product [Rotaria magnacalcarata]CAF3914597.1 unnamed protein product [Rotaria magnacalcarata]
MTTSQSLPTTPMYFVLTDSHGKFVPPTITTINYRIMVKAILGLKCIDKYSSNLSALAVLSTSCLDSHLASSHALMLLVGTNPVRCDPASSIITHIKTIIIFLCSTYPHLSGKHCINIVPCFPCFKPFYPLNTYHSLLNNIAQYNSQLFDLSITLNFTIVNFNVMDHHIGPDRMHLDYKYSTIVKNSIVDYEYLSSTLTPLPIKTIGRSREAKARRNKLRHTKLLLKQQQYYLTRPVESPWCLKSIKTHLHQQKIKLAKIPPIYRKTLRIQFNNTVDLEIAEATLPQDAFSQRTYPLTTICKLTFLSSFFPVCKCM